METGIQTRNLRIGGMTCVNCQNRIERKLRSTPGIEGAEVSYNAGTAAVTYNAELISVPEIAAIIETLGYSAQTGDAPQTGTDSYRTAGVLIIIFAAFMLVQNSGLLTFFNRFPLAESGMGYGMLFLIGIITSVHCLAMCGGINLSQAAIGSRLPHTNTAGSSRMASLGPSFLYNLGRVVSYTAVGIIVGALGSVISFSGAMRGIIQSLAGVFMVIMGINMLGIFPVLRRFNIRMPKIFAARIGLAKERYAPGYGKSPLYVGLLNGLMPCGPLQAMQLYALGTGSPITGGISMLLFSLGTVPLMFGLGAVSSLLSRRRRFTKAVMTVSAMLVVILGLSMFSYGWNLGNFSNILGFSRGNTVSAAAAAFTPTIADGVQVVNSTLSGGRYPAITVQEGIPVRWTIDAPQGSINGCNNRMIIREYGIEHRFKTGENVVEFTPTRTGKFSYSCWMGMIRSSITVVAQGESIAADSAESPANLTPVPAGVTIPTDNVAIAEVNRDAGYQVVTINLRDSGFEPAIVVVQRGLPANWIINNDSLDEGNYRLIVPAYLALLDMEAGDNGIQFVPGESFDFSSGDNVYYGYVKVVEDIDSIDINAIKGEVDAFETLVYPEAYFEAQANQGGCCGGRAG
ncbi:heavy metal-associated domain-containing protein [Spirochaetia bacterium]|nr:heavy metal-associated domain-containing protein [Spirochaetia bacterium]